MSETIKVGNTTLDGSSLFLISGPCVIEDMDTCFQIAESLKNVCAKNNIPLIFKASYDKANRTSLHSYRGPGMDEGLKILAEIKKEFDIPVISDVHDVHEVEKAAEVLDMIQIPAFLCRQTDLILETARTMKPVNIKKGQFLAPWDMSNIVDKAKSVGNQDILLTERGAAFGYNNLVVDFRGLKVMQDLGTPVIFDATHSVQIPGGKGTSSGGRREFAPVLARSAVAAGADGIFLEVHPDPDRALCDGANSLTLTELPRLITQLKSIREAVLS